jgi:drug/metabolite transporter (DMT)-like permease
LADIIVFVASHLGEFIALSVAVLWGVGSVLYTWIGKSIHPIELKPHQEWCGGFTFFYLGAFLGGIPGDLSWRPVVFLLISGALGIGLGDTAYFTALQLIGVRQASLLKILAPPMAGWIAYLAMQEEMSSKTWVGTILTVVGVAWVITERRKDTDPSSIKRTPKIIFRGVFFGLFAAASEAGGMVLSHAAMTQSTIDPALASGTRLLAGLFIAAITILFTRNKIFQWLESPSRNKIILASMTAILMGTFTGIWLQQMALQRIPAGVAQTLIATSPVFVMFVTAILGEKITLRNLFGVICSIVGVSLFFL